jgi:hypothetical protein
MTQGIGTAVYVSEEQKLRDMLRDSRTGEVMSDERLMDRLDHIGLYPYQFDVGPDNEIILRLSYQLLLHLVGIQESVPLDRAAAMGTIHGRRGHTLTS